MVRITVSQYPLGRYSMSKVVLNGVPLECKVTPSLQISGSKVWSTPVRINGGMAHGITINNYEYPPCPTGTVLYFPGLPGQGATIWDRAGTNNGAITGATWVRLPSGLWVLSFDGNDKVTITDNAGIRVGTGDFTIGCWAYVNAIGAIQVFMAKGNDTSTEFYWLRKNATDVVNFFTQSAAGTSQVSSTATMAAAGWYRIIGTRVTTTLTIYVNAVAATATGQTVRDVTGTRNLLLGVREADPPNFTGWLAGRQALSFLNPTTAWTAAQVANDYAQTRSLLGV